ncbi:hypothetical protein E4U55_006669 [Claviceps digitariae]|nr:hypothetical protein E4U55_006669 [Claviceps digitariae]
MVQGPPAESTIGDDGHGLRFLNGEWNDSISNGQPFILTWNLPMGKPGPQLDLFRIRYPKDGIMVFDLVLNLTGPIDSMSYEWTPNYLGKNELYTLWLSDGQYVLPNWTISPPWTPKASEDMSRNNSMDTVITFESLSEPDNGLMSKPSIWLITPSPGPSSIFMQEVLREEPAAGMPISRTSTLVAQSSA